MTANVRIKAACTMSGEKRVIKVSIGRTESLDWHIAGAGAQEHILTSLQCYLENEWDVIKDYIYWGINATTVAIENEHDVGIVMLFKGNVGNSMIQHIPPACILKGIPFISLVKRVVLPRHLPMKRISSLVIKQSNVILNEINSLLERHHNVFRMG